MTKMWKINDEDNDGDTDWQNSLEPSAQVAGADPGFGVKGDEIRQGDLKVLLLLSQMFMERMMQEN